VGLARLRKRVERRDAFGVLRISSSLAAAIRSSGTIWTEPSSI
jgi:hypothetical protein